MHEMLLKGRKLFVLHVEDTGNKTQRAESEGRKIYVR